MISFVGLLLSARQVLSRLLTWFMTTRVGRIVGAVLLGLVALKVAYWRGGAAEKKKILERREKQTQAQVAAAKEAFDETTANVADADHAALVDQLRNDGF